jgi:hypothetical protein
VRLGMAFDLRYECGANAAARRELPIPSAEREKFCSTVRQAAIDAASCLSQPALVTCSG